MSLPLGLPSSCAINRKTRKQSRNNESDEFFRLKAMFRRASHACGAHFLPVVAFPNLPFNRQLCYNQPNAGSEKNVGTFLSKNAFWTAGVDLLDDPKNGD